MLNKFKILVFSMAALSLLAGCGKKPEGHAKVQKDALQIDIDNTVSHQEIDGFGAGYTYYSNYVYFAKYKDEIYDLLFSDAHLSILRFKNSFLYDEAVDYKPEKEEDFNVEFDPKTERDFYENAVSRFEKLGIKPKVLMSSWSPAPYLKSSETLYGEGTLAKDEAGNYVYDKYGEYWYQALKAYNEAGVPVDYLSIQNEPDYVAAYESCSFDPEESGKAASYQKAFDATYKACMKLENPPKMIAPETMSFKISSLSKYIDAILENNPESLYGIGHHLYVGASKGKPYTYNLEFASIAKKYPDLKKWQTEYYEGDFMDTVQIIQNALQYENLNCYIFWGGVWKNPGSKEMDNLIGMDAGTDEETWDHEHGYIIGEKYYSMRHFSEYILPGYIRIDTKVHAGDDEEKEEAEVTSQSLVNKELDDLSCTAYISPDKDKIVLVSVNDTDENKKLQYQFADYHIDSSKVILTNYQNGENTEEFYTESGSLDELQCYEIPAHSVATIVIDGTTDADMESSAASGTLAPSADAK